MNFYGIYWAGQFRSPGWVPEKGKETSAEIWGSFSILGMSLGPTPPCSSRVRWVQASPRLPSTTVRLSR